MKKILLLAVILFCASQAFAQVPVTLSPYQRQQFFDSNGNPLAGGKLCTYQAGTSTPLATYSDSTGLFQNSNPLILDSSGFGSVWLTANAYRFILLSAGSDNTCSTGIQQWVLDFVTPPAFLNGNNAWTGNQTFAGTSTFNGPVNLNAGGALNGSFSGSPSFSGTPSFINGAVFGTVSPIFNVVPIFNAGIGSGTLIPTPSLGATPVTQSFTNNGVIGTTVNKLVKLSSTTVVNATVADSTGIVGICVSGCGIGGTSQIAIAGQFSCTFDSATVAGDYVQPSNGSAGSCHDFGSSPPPTQVVGRVLSTNGGAGLYLMQIMPAEDVNNTQFCGTTAGSANVQTLTPALPVGAYFVGFTCRAIAGFTNTSAATLAINGLAATALRKRTGVGLAPLTGGELFLGEQFEVVYDGTFFQIAAEPSGSTDAVPTMTLKKGPNTGNYVTAGVGSFAVMDGANLAYTVTIPVGSKLTVTAAGTMSPTGGVTTWYIALFDSATKLTQQELTWTAAGASNACPGGQNCGSQNFNLNYMLIGDGASHTVQLEYSTEAASNDTTGRTLNANGMFPTMTFILSPSN